MKHPLIARTLLTTLLTSLAGPAFAAPAEPSWVLSGYLPSAPNEKVYLTIKNQKIDSISSTQPSGSGLVIQTEDLIFPGLIDSHSHVKYNILPLWGLAKGQFLNRFEWRQKFPAYKDAVSFNMKAFKGDTICAAVRYAEVKSAIGGATALQGIGGDGKCAKDFGIRNFELTDDWASKTKIRGMTDYVMPQLLGSVFEPMIRPSLNQGQDYDRAYAQFLQSTGVNDWIHYFRTRPKTIQNGVWLLMKEEVSTPGNTLADWNGVKPTVKAKLMAAPYNLDAAKADKQLAAMETFLFGTGNNGYLTANDAENTAFTYLSKGGVLTVPSNVRRYIGMFEDAVRKSALGYFADPSALAIVVHLAEGRRDDKYNQSEFKYAKTLNLIQPGLSIIHGVGMSRADMDEAATKGVSMVWSPFSNLLLYGQTLDVEAARAAGLNVALGVDWTPTGSKHMLDEIKLAKRYLVKNRINSISDEELVKMATINAAKAIRRDSVAGRVAQGYFADLLLVSKKAGNPYSALVDAQQKDVKLVVVKGQPIYGESDRIAKAAQAFGDSAKPETLPMTVASQEKCGFKKGLRLPYTSAYDRTLFATAGAPRLNTMAGIAGELSSKAKAYADKIQASGTPREKASLIPGIDPLFNCEDAAYSKRFADFVEKELDENASKRDVKRAQAGLQSGWTPVSGSPDEIDSIDE